MLLVISRIAMLPCAVVGEHVVVLSQIATLCAGNNGGLVGNQILVVLSRIATLPVLCQAQIQDVGGLVGSKMLVLSRIATLPVLC